jgi:hypothetical protein
LLRRSSDAHFAIASRATLEERIAETCVQAAAILGAETASVTVDEAPLGPEGINAELPGAVGRLVLTAPTGRPWTEADRRSLQRLLSLIGSPIDDARRLELGQRMRHLRAVLGRPSAARDVLVAFRDAGAATIGADIAVVRLDDAVGNGVDWPTPGPTVVLDQVAVTGTARYVAVDGIDRAWWAVLPLGVFGESMGVVAIGYRRRQPFDAVQRSFLELVATVLAYVIDQSGAYAREHAARAEAERTSAQLRLLQRFASDLSTADTSRRVAHILLRRIVRSTGAFGGAVVSTVRAPRLETIATVGLDGEAVDAIYDVANWLLRGRPVERRTDHPRSRRASVPSRRAAR